VRLTTLGLSQFGAPRSTQAPEFTGTGRGGLGHLALARWAGCPPARCAATSNVEEGNGTEEGDPATFS